jgi:calcium-dependent protein kinase
MAPEIFNNEYDSKSDIWSCGVILYILLCGYPPYNGNEKEIKVKIRGALYSFKGKKDLFSFLPGEEWNDISEGAKNLLRKMFEVNPAERITAE